MKDKIFVTRPLLPDVEQYIEQVKSIFASQWLTNMGQKHNLLEREIRKVLKVPHFSLFANGTIALLTALKALELPPGSEIITTPFTFAATAHCIVWNNCTPVFCDIEETTMCIDADKIENLITPRTSAILGVHVYGFPCDVHRISEIAEKHSLKVIYDAAHAFATEIDGVGIGSFGDITMFSFHATKLFNTIEGGGLSCNQPSLDKKIRSLRNFGIQSAEIVEDVGINGKMNEFQAAMGLENLKIFRGEQKRRTAIKKIYDDRLKETKGIRIPQFSVNIRHSYQYYPIVIEEGYALSRNQLCQKLAQHNIYTRKYFYPPCTDFTCYRENSSVTRAEFPVLDKIKEKVLCLPFYGSLPADRVEEICNYICNPQLL